MLLVLVVLLLASCGTLSPIYDFYAHKHVVPIIGAKYTHIPDNAPHESETFDNHYGSITPQVIDLLEVHRQTINSPGISAAVAINGKLIWAGASGWANIENNEMMTPKSQFRIGSTSKALNSVLLARLVDDNKIALDTPLSAFEISQLNASWRGITPRQLASHTAGIPHYKDNGDLLGLYQTMALQTRYTDVAQSVDVFDGSDTLFAPGEHFSYSSLGTVLLSAVMQEAAQQSYQQAMIEKVLTPLHLTSTLPEPRVAEYAMQSPDIATFYWHPDHSESRVTPWRDVDLSHRLAGGGFISTSSDLVRLGVGFLNNDFVSTDTRDTFWTVQKLNNGADNEQGYAIGWRVRKSDFGASLGTLFHANHGGVSRGAQSWLMVIPQYKMAVAVNINAKTEEFWDFAKVSYELVRIFLTHYHQQSATDVTP